MPSSDVNTLTRSVIFNADDFGFTPDVNEGILHCHLHGVLRATTLMGNGDAFDDAVGLARQYPSLDVGAHLVLIQGRSLVTGRPLPGSWKELLFAVAQHRLDPYEEFRAQVNRIVAAGIEPTHFDTHKHTHVLPQVLSAVVRLAKEFNVPFIRLPFDAGWRFVRPLDLYGRRVLRRGGLRVTDHFAGFKLTDTLSERTLLSSIPQLRAGVTEFMCHPGFLKSDLRIAKTRLKESRERELAALTCPAVRTELESQRIALTTYRELAARLP